MRDATPSPAMVTYTFHHYDRGDVSTCLNFLNCASDAEALTEAQRILTDDRLRRVEICEGVREVGSTPHDSHRLVAVTDARVLRSGLNAAITGRPVLSDSQPARSGLPRGTRTMRDQSIFSRLPLVFVLACPVPFLHFAVSHSR